MAHRDGGIVCHCLLLVIVCGLLVIVWQSNALIHLKVAGHLKVACCDFDVRWSNVLMNIMVAGHCLMLTTWFRCCVRIMAHHIASSDGGIDSKSEILVRAT